MELNPTSVKPIGVVLLRLLQAIGLGAAVWGIARFPALVTYVQGLAQGAAWSWPGLSRLWLTAVAPGLVAVPIIAAIEQLLAASKREAAALKTHATQPWLANPHWAAGHIRQNNRAVLWGVGAFILLYLGVAIPLAVMANATPAYAFAGVIGFFALVFFRMIWLNRRWNRAELKLATVPGVLGGPFSAVAILHEIFPPETVFDINLRCVESLQRGSGKNRRTEWVDRWTSTIYIQKTLRGDRPNTTLVPMSFAIPLDAWPTQATGQATVRWLLSIREKVEVPLGGAVFEVPVYRTADSRRDYQLDSELIGEYLERIEPEAILRRYNMVRERVSDNQETFEFHEFNLPIFTTLIVMAMALVGLVLGLRYWMVEQKAFWFASAFPIVFLLMFVYGIVHMLFWRSRLTITRGSTNMVEAQSGIWGFRKRLTLPLDRSTRLTCKLDHRVNEKEQWSVLLSGREGQSLRLLGTLNGSSEAQAVASWLGQHLQIQAQTVRSDDGFLTKPN